MVYEDAHDVDCVEVVEVLHFPISPKENLDEETKIVV